MLSFAHDRCGKTTWFGCGLHIPHVMDPLAEDEKCSCEEHNPTPMAPRTVPYQYKPEDFTHKQTQ